jgi:photosystem II stability/assembly factor-like uncharacterized protein
MLPGLLSLLLAAPVRADDLPAPAPPVAPIPIAVGAIWKEERGTHAMTAGLWSLTRAADGTTWLLGLEDGAVYRSMDGARTWSRVLRPPDSDDAGADDESALLAGESVVEEEEEEARKLSSAEDDAASEEATSESVVDDPEAEASASDGSSASAATESADVAGADLDRVQSEVAASLGASGPRRPAVVWFSPDDSDLALVGRADGIWRSTDGGRSWSRRDGADHALRFLGVPAMGLVVAGTTSGVRVSPDGGQRWFDTVDVTDGRAVDALVVLGDQVLAGTGSGLFASADGLRWKRLPLTGAVTGLLPDPGWPGGLWVTTPSGLLRSDDGGATFYTAGRQVLSGLRGLTALSGTGHVAAWGYDGVWESTDGGVTWRPVFKGLRDPDVRDLVVVGDQPLIAASRSIWRLTVGVPADEEAITAGRLTASIPLDEQRLLGTLVDVATRRPGLDLRVLAPEALAAKRWLPTVVVDGRYGTHDARDAEFLQGQTDEGRDGEWYVGARVCFGRCAASGLYDIADPGDTYASVDSAELATMAADQVADDVNGFYALGGQVVGEGSEAFAATNTGQRMRKYRGQVADQVVGAWATLQRLDRDPAPSSLAGHVARLLDIQEAEARLDLYTDGAYSRARLTEPKP